MIPPKLYIPTSTLNFNSIMASESISPAAFYARRGFGYQRFEKIAPNSLENVILLYNKYPVFTIEEKDSENYPMVIEINTQNMHPNHFQETNHIYFSQETIYLNPFDVRFIFRTQSELTNTYLRAERSIESKMIPLYKNCFCCKNSHIEDFIWEKTDIQDLPQPDCEAIKKDIQINKLKGLLYAYLLASNKSLPNDIVILRKNAKALQNTLSAIISNPTEIATTHQIQRLDFLYDTINKTFCKIKGIDIQIEKIIKQKSDTYNCQLISILKKEKLYDIWLERIFSELHVKPYQLPPFNCSNKNIPENLASLNNYIETLNGHIRQQFIPTKTNSTELPVTQGMKIIQIPQQKDFLSKLLNRYLQENDTKITFIQDRYTFARKGGELFRDELSRQNKWEGSSYQRYVNNLLRHLKNYDTFDVNATDNHILKSFSAFCQKGEADIDKLEDYLIENEIGDFRIAFACWGMIFGFAEMPKTLTNELFTLDDANYISSIYKHILNQIHEVKLTGTLSLSSKITEQRTFTIHDKIDHPSHVSYTLPAEVKSVFRLINIHIKTKKAQEYYKKSILEQFKENQSENLMKIIKDIKPYSKTKTIWNNLIKSVMQKNEAQLSLFENSNNHTSNNKHFIYQLNCIKGWSDKIIRRLIDNWDFTFDKHPGDKEEHIKHFINLCKKEGKEPHNELTGFFLETIAKKIEAEIREKYDR